MVDIDLSKKKQKLVRLVSLRNILDYFEVFFGKRGLAENIKSLVLCQSQQYLSLMVFLCYNLVKPGVAEESALS